MAKVMIKNVNKQKVLKNMDEVIKTSSKVRDFLLDENVADTEKLGKLDFCKQVISANKNIVSATIVEMSVYKLAEVVENND